MRPILLLALLAVGCAQIPPQPAADGHGGWKSDGKRQIEFGPMAITRAVCPPGSMHDHVVKQLPYIQSYLIKAGHLFLSLMADGGTYEFEPAP